MKKLLSCLTSAPSTCQNVIFVAKKTFLNVGPKLFYLGIFELELEKTTVLCFFYISTLKFFQTKFCSKIKIFKFGTKIVVIEYFELKFKKLMSNLKSVSSHLLTCKVSSENQKNLNLGAKIPYFSSFWAAI